MSPRVARPWFRFYVEAVNDPKLLRLTPAQRWLWVCILAAARRSPVPGTLMLTEQVPLTVPELARASGLREREVRTTVTLMTTLGMVDVCGDGALIVPNWTARQYESDNSSRRTAKWRHNGNGSDVTTGVTVTDQSTETETETENPPPSVGPPRTRGSRIPDGFEVDEAMADWAETDCPLVEPIMRETQQFYDYWKAASGKTAVKLDWGRAWKVWMRKAQIDAERRQRGSRQAELRR